MASASYGYEVYEMSELNDEIVNKGLAKVMGAGLIIDNKTILNGNAVTYILNEMGSRSKPFTESLDALVPVWEKIGLQKNEVSLHGRIEGYNQFNIVNEKDQFSETTKDLSIQQSAAYATYKACKELGLI